MLLAVGALSRNPNSATVDGQLLMGVPSWELVGMHILLLVLAAGWLGSAANSPGRHPICGASLICAQLIFYAAVGLYSQGHLFGHLGLIVDGIVGVIALVGFAMTLAALVPKSE